MNKEWKEALKNIRGDLYVIESQERKWRQQNGRTIRQAGKG